MEQPYIWVTILYILNYESIERWGSGVLDPLRRPHPPRKLQVL